jgi:pyridoxal 5'-phosphate synthase pdxT subunit
LASSGKKRIGVLAVQGAFARHAQVLSDLGHDARLVREPRDFVGLDGIVLPGGESTVQLEMIGRLALEAPLRELCASERPVLATCAGLILLAHAVTDPAQKSFDAIDIDVVRNGWGRQLDSFQALSDQSLPGDSEPLPLVFIRAPRIGRVGRRAEVLASFRGEPVLVSQRNVTGATFHPELTGDPRVHARVFGSSWRSEAPG